MGGSPGKSEISSGAGQKVEIRHPTTCLSNGVALQPLGFLNQQNTPPYTSTPMIFRILQDSQHFQLYSAMLYKTVMIKGDQAS